jgi:hypothetical protein
LANCRPGMLAKRIARIESLKGLAPRKQEIFPRQGTEFLGESQHKEMM